VTITAATLAEASERAERLWCRQMHKPLLLWTSYDGTPPTGEAAKFPWQTPHIHTPESAVLYRNESNV
jgi:hypothetical protein